MIRSHPADTTLFACAAGTLPAPHATVVAAHLAYCSRCRGIIETGEAVAGEFLEAAEPKPLSDGALQRALARLDQPHAEPPRPAATLAGLTQGGRWYWLGPGIRLMPLARRDATQTRLDLIRIAPGVAVPSHGHKSFESTCVLQGGFADQTGEYHEGDVAEGDAPLEHAPRALPGGDCICLIATTGRLKAHGWVARLLQPLIDV